MQLVQDWEYVDQLQARPQKAYATVIERIGTATQCTKRRYDRSVHAMKLGVGTLVWYSCPRRRPGKYHKYRRLSQVCYVIQRFNVVLYRVKLSTKSALFVAHVDRLRPAFLGKWHRYGKHMERPW